jgi:uncharacterized membrane protein
MDSATAHAMFMAFLQQTAAERIVMGASPDEVIDWLKSQGCPPSAAIDLQRQLREQVEHSVREQAGAVVRVDGILIAAAALIIGLVSLASREVAAVLLLAFMYFGSGCPIVGGFLLGLLGWLTGRHPASYSKSELKLVGWASTGLILFLLWGANGLSVRPRNSRISAPPKI